MDYKFWFEKGSKWLENREWDQAYLAFSKCIDMDRNRQTYYPLIAYTAAMTGNISEATEWFSKPFKELLITDLDRFQELLKKEQWIQIFKIVGEKQKSIDALTKLLMEYFSVETEKKIQLLLNFNPSDKIEKYWQHALILDINKNCFANRKEKWQLNINAIDKHYDEAISLFPKYALTYYLYAYVVSDLPSYDSTYLEEAIELNGAYLEALNMRAWLFFQDDMYEDALKDYTVFIDNSIELDGLLLHALEKRAYAFLEIGKVFEAILDYNKIVANYPENIKVWHLRAHARRLYKDFQGALDDYQVSIQKNDELAFFCYGRRGDICVQLEDYSGALENYTLAIAKDNKQPNVYRKRAEVNRKLNRQEAAANDERTSSEILINNALKNSG